MLERVRSYLRRGLETRTSTPIVQPDQLIGRQRWESTSTMSLKASGALAVVFLGTTIGAILASGTGNHELSQTLTMAAAASGPLSLTFLAHGLSNTS